MAIIAVAAFLVFYFPVLLGQRVIFGGDVLYQFLPWAAAPEAHAPANNMVFDPILQVLPWQQLIQDDITHGRLPLWNPQAQSGVPLLANDAAAAFSPFTWIAMPFAPAVGLSLAMLAKLLVAGLGMAFYLRVLKVGGLAAVAAGVAYAASSFMVVWLQWPQSGVSAVMPWAFAGLELFLRGERRWSLPLTAVAVAAQFLAGNAESSLHFGFALGLYGLIRWAMTGLRWQIVAGLAASVVVGVLIAGIQLVPFIELLRGSALVSDRATAGMGFAHLHLSAVTTWVFPNIAGNPGIDAGVGRYPNFSESSGFATVAMAVLSPVGLWSAWRSNRSVAVALAVIGLAAAAIVYGILTPVSGRLPLFANADNGRMTILICFCVAAFGGIGFDTIVRGPLRKRRKVLAMAGWLGAAALVGFALAALEFSLKGQAVERMLPPVHGYVGFWLATGLLAFGAATGLAAGALFGSDRRWAAIGLGALVILEALLFAIPFNPREPLSAVPPPNPAVAWLQANAGDHSVAALGTTLIPETSILYGLTDVRGYEILLDPRERMYWSAADPGYSDNLLFMNFQQPGADWLAAAGVGYVMMAPDQVIPGTAPVYSSNGVVIASVPNPRPFAYAPQSVAAAADSSQALDKLRQNPLGPVVVEGCCPRAGQADITVTKRVAGETDLSVSAQGPATIVVEQSFEPGWQADVDGRPVTIQAADLLFQSVQVPSGSHLVQFVYRPHSVAQGAALSAAGLIGLIVISVLPSLARRRSLPR
jgi:hypothetical protein